MIYKYIERQNIRILSIIPVLLCFLFLSSVAYSESDQVDMVIQNLNSENRDLRLISVWTLRKVKDPRALDALIKALSHEDLHVREKVAEALGERKDTKAIEPLIAALKDKGETVSGIAAKSLQEITGKDFGQDHDKWKEWWEKNKENFQKEK
jgi:HEAT repeat protein